MTDLALFLDAFHFIRPFVLLGIPVVLLLWWRIRDRRRPEAALNDGLAPHLRQAMMLGADARRRVQPIDGVAAVLLLSILGAAGPTWSRVPDPFMAQTAPLVVVLKVSQSMESTDVAPSRLERGKQKIRDLLDLRAGARTALVAYASTAHRVVPLTEDAQIMVPYLEGLSSDIMPDDGANAGAAMEIATAILAGEDMPGGVLFVTDGLETADTSALSPTDQMTTAVLAMLPEGQRDRGLDGLTGVPVVPVTPGTDDVKQLDRLLNAAYRRALLDDENQQWDDRGWWLIWPAAVLTLLWFRRGWTMQWGVVLAACLTLASPARTRADGITDWFFTPDQQGQIAFNRRDYAAASETFVDPLWQGYALFRYGQYAKAVEVLGRVETAEADFIRGLALIRNRSYRDGVRAFESALERDPDYPGAAENLETAKRIVAYVEEAQEQSDTGEESGIGADDIVFDNESGRGADSRIEAPTDAAPEILSTEQWMNTVNTKTSDFLRLRFLLEANQGS